MRKIKQRKLYKLVEVLPYIYPVSDTQILIKAWIQYGRLFAKDEFLITPEGVVQVSDGVLPKFILDEIAEALWVNFPHWKRLSTHSLYVTLADKAIKFLEESAKVNHEHHDHNAN